MPAASVKPTEIVSGLASVADRYDTILCDVWGVLHNGISAFPEAGDALARFREAGGTVVLITNAPRPHGIVQAMLEGLNARTDAWDAIVTSGDVTRERSPIAPAARHFIWGRSVTCLFFGPRRVADHAGGSRLRRVHRPVRRQHGNAGRLRNPAGQAARTRADDDMRQPGSGGGARQRAAVLRWRPCGCL